MRKVIDFIKETFPYIIIGMLGTYIYADNKLEGKRLPSATDMPYVNQENLDNDTLIRNATRGGYKGQIESHMQLEEL